MHSWDLQAAQRIPGGAGPIASSAKTSFSVSPQVWDLKDLGLQAAQRILGGADPLALLTEVAQNFPALAGPLSRLEPSPELRADLAANRRLMQVPIGCWPAPGKCCRPIACTSRAPRPD